MAYLVFPQPFVFIGSGLSQLHSLQRTKPINLSYGKGNQQTARHLLWECFCLAGVDKCMPALCRVWGTDGDQREEEHQQGPL